MFSVEKKCSHQAQGYTWSVKLVTAARSVHYWKEHWSNYLNGSKDSKSLQELGTTLNVQYVQVTLSEINKRPHSARKALRTCQENAAHLRDRFLEEMAQMYTTSGNTNIATIIKNLQHCKEVWTAFTFLRYAAKGNVANSVSIFKVPDPFCNNSTLYPETLSSLQFQHLLKEIDDSDEIMDKLISQNKLHLHQAWETPFAQ
eukprot:6406024-Ditylum_brightwellii.AAC.1